MKTKICSKCQIEKNVEEFSKRSASKDGLCGWCKQCDNEYHKEYRQQNTEKIKECKKKHYQKNPDKIKKYRQNNVLRIAFNGARKRALKKNLPFDITLEWLEERYTGCSELSKIKFEFIEKGVSPYSPSVDRIDNSKGYTQDNVRLITAQENIAINRWGLESFLEMAKAVIEYQQNIT